MVIISVIHKNKNRIDELLSIFTDLYENSTEIRQAAGAPAATFLHAGCTLRKVSHDFAPLRRAQFRPAANFLDRAVTADTDPLTRVNGAQLDTGAVNLISFPNIIDILHFYGTARICRARSRAPCKI